MFHKRMMLFTFLTLLLTSTFTILLSNLIQPCRTETQHIFQAQSIQETIDRANPGDTIFVHNGTYYEQIFINKTLTLIGENPTTTILDGKAEITPIVRIFAPNVTFVNFTVRNTDSASETYGIYVRNAQNITIANSVVKETYHGIRIENSSYCQIMNNTILKNYAYGIYLIQNGSYNLFTGNNLLENPIGVYLAAGDCQNNTFYHNNFINNMNQVQTFGNYTFWDNGTEGNYWSDYTGEDKNDDGIGDTPYTNFGVNDRFPLMKRWGLKQPSTLSIVINPSTVIIGETVTINGTLQPPITTNIIIQYRFQGETEWKNLTETTTNIQGTFSYNWTPSIPEYYALMAYWEGNDTTLPATSPIVHLNVTRKSSTLTINVNPTTVAVGSNIMITGNLTPQLREQDIIISYQPLPITTWKTLATVKTDPSGIYSYNWTTTEVGMFILKASWLGDEQTSGNESYSGFILITKASINITISIQPQTAKVGLNITISGKITPKREYTNITIQFYASKGSITWNVTTQTDSNGNYQYVWITSDIGTYYIKAIWLGDNLTSPGESETIKAEVVEQGEENLIWQYITAGIIATMVLAALAHLRRKKQK